jgi:hypothetical protein
MAQTRSTLSLRMSNAALIASMVTIGLILAVMSFFAGLTAGLTYRKREVNALREKQTIQWKRRAF